MINGNDYIKVEVTKVRGLSPVARETRFRIVDKKDAANFTFTPGQFITVYVPGYDEAPLTITTSPSELPELEVAVRSIGNATTAINRLKQGETAYIRGPLGNSANFDKIYGRELLVIAGGIGIAPLRSIIRWISEDSKLVSKLTIVYGAKDPESLIFKNELEKWKKFADVHITVDKADSDWNGLTGNIPDLLKKLDLPRTTTAIVCGPPVIYEKIVNLLDHQGIKPENISLMLERRMHCGIGKCQHCTCGEKYVCTDGPTFTVAEIADNWEALR